MTRNFPECTSNPAHIFFLLIWWENNNKNNQKNDLYSIQVNIKNILRGKDPFDGSGGTTFARLTASKTLNKLHKGETV